MTSSNDVKNRHMEPSGPNWLSFFLGLWVLSEDKETVFNWEEKLWFFYETGIIFVNGHSMSILCILAKSLLLKVNEDAITVCVKSIVMLCLFVLVLCSIFISIQYVTAQKHLGINSTHFLYYDGSFLNHYYCVLISVYL